MNEKNSHLTVPFSEKLKGIPGIFGIRLGESPLYETIFSEGDIEIRKYHPYVLASITIKGNFEEARKEAFMSLANYIFGKNKDGKNLKMTSPVLQDVPMLHAESELGWTMSFILPHKYSVATAPTPKDNRIHLHKNQAKLVASLRYSGLSSEEKIAEHTSRLMEWISRSQDYSVIGEIQFAQYDGPTTIPFLRKNEIHIEVGVLN
jgi:hypothetical protein